MNVGIIGGTGYTGLELIRILLSHNDVNISVITSKANAGKKISDLYPYLKGVFEKKLVPFSVNEFKKAKIDLAFLCLPHGESMAIVPKLISSGIKVIDLAADFRFNDKKIYEKWYKQKHKSSALLKKSIYGLSEINREKIRSSDLIANPGCYATVSILSLYPLVKENIINKDFIIINALSGVSGAGKKVASETSFLNVNENLSAYKVAEHRHTPEINEMLKAKVNFTPHLLPVNRGIFMSAYAYLKPKVDYVAISNIYERYYKNEKFIQLLSRDKFPSLNEVKGTNNCAIGFKVNEETRTVIIISTIDNLIKGASGQAVQNMNIMMDYNEEEGLINKGLFP